MRIRFLTLCFLLLSGFQLSAELLVKQYREQIKSTDAAVLTFVKLYVQGLGDGIIWANSEVETQMSKHLFCQPTKLALTQSNYLNILDRQIEYSKTLFTEAELEKAPIGFFLLKGLVDTFPCPKGK
jgi:hypothetical protein